MSRHLDCTAETDQSAKSCGQQPTSLVPFRTTLRNETPILVRPVVPNDRDLLQMGMRHLSLRSRYNRFFSAAAELSEDALRKFTDVDDTDHLAVGALDLTFAEAYPIGVARCIRLEDGGDTAEVAVTVIDSHQRLGLGTILLASLSHVAAAAGISTFVATVLAENRGMLGLFKKLGGKSQYDGAGSMTVHIPVHACGDRYPDTSVGRAFRRIYALID